MPDVNTVVRYRRRRRASTRSGAAGLSCAGLIALLAAVTAILAAFQYSRAVQGLPSIEILTTLLESPGGLLLQPTRLYDRSGQHLLLELQPPDAPRKYLRLPGSPEGEPQFAEPLISATLAAADPGFYNHAGFSASGLLTGEATTIAQRLASELLLTGEPPSMRRALRERLLAAQLTQRFGRAKVLEWYLNSAAYGRLAYGAEAAARLYLGKSAADLDLAEAALIAATALEPQSNPIDDPQAALRNQKRLLLEMLNQRRAAPAAASAATLQTLQLRSGSRPGSAVQIADLNPQVEPAFLRLALDEVASRIPRPRLERGGLKILTTLDFSLQVETACAVNAQRNQLAGEPPADGSPGCAAARLLPAPDAVASEPGSSAEALVLDPQSGQILAMAFAPGGGSTAVEGTLPRRPLGTLGTPFIYLTAFTRGLAPASLLWDIPAEGAAAQGEYHGPVRLRTALANDYTAPANQVLEQVGVENAWRTLRQFGLDAPDNPDIAAPDALNVFRPLDLLEAGRIYAVLANRGAAAGRVWESGEDVALPAALPPVRLVAVLRVDPAQPSAETFPRDWSAVQSRPIISPEPVYLMTHVLSDETARRPSLGHPNPLEIGRPTAAKIGASPAGAWTAGYTPQRTAVVWIGPGDQNTPSQNPAGLVSAAAGLYHAVMITAHTGLAVETPHMPEGITTLRVCDPSGMLPTVYCPNVVEEVFLAGNEPLQADRLFRSVAINRETGRLATIFTPADLVDQRPFLIAPPEAAEWAQAAGLDTPPNIYDSINGQPQAQTDVHLITPQMFAVVRGQVELRGTAAGPGLSIYRIQIGKGLNPQGWVQIGDEYTKAVRNGQLAVWDTAGLNGVYAVELLAVRDDASVQRAVTLVTVDNLPPQVQIISPVQHEEISPAERPQFVLLAEVKDDLEIVQVEIYLNGRLLGRFTQAPYALSWAAVPGEHNVRVVATDAAGNVGEAQAPFTVVEP